MKKMLLAVNTKAGLGKVAASLSQIVDCFQDQGYRVTVYQTRKDELPKVISNEASDYDTVVCIGGDGTLNETINGLMNLETRPNLGYIPAGTMNDITSTLGMPKKMMECAKVIAEGNTRPMDINRFNDRYFDYIAAFGSFVDVSYATSREAKNSLGLMAYFWEVAKRVPKLRSYHVKVEYDGNVFEDEVMIGMVSNGTYMGGFALGEQFDARIDDGLAEVIMLKKPVNLNDTVSLVDSYLTGKLAASGGVFYARAKNIKITTSEPLPWTLDGEFGGEHFEVECENIKHAVNIFAPLKPMIHSHNQYNK